ncbi:hypothetical protein CXP39_02700 [Mesoplasma syrphidae]|uniref:Uncharacterized protein n=1 Tax=Mesoplasma syrphidae TaxID=225999 RepID=A0A2K9CDG7_9MOLU|nr:hypothetical protein [Mesoplasma syrphidae]AUF83694.1 hypothetical protein CXP39_02700 [Mesoplasma syrphidae]
MKKMSAAVMKQTEGGAVSGAFLAGLGKLITASTLVVSEIVGTLVGINVINNHPNKGSFKVGSVSGSWDDTTKLKNLDSIFLSDDYQANNEVETFQQNSLATENSELYDFT